MIPGPEEETREGLRVVRDDLLGGGTKTRALYPLVARGEAAEYVYAGPALGYAQLALAHACRHAGRTATCFVPRRAELTPLSAEAHALGARVVEVAYGRLTVLQARAREYAARRPDACLLPFGLDTPAIRDALAAAARALPPPDEVWVAAGSGTLTRALQQAWPDARHHAVQVGAVPDVGLARRWVAPERFEQPAERPPPFPSTAHYDAKVWRFASESASPGALLWNVAA